ncbi:MAG: hypothetical protein IPJ74_07920 [Saprospiraceae bacterium]|nr:hypothetical protein [Saprospiraceae bacterium]
MQSHNIIRLILSLLLGLIAWALIIYKAFAIPITHDELSTILHYYTYNVWEIMMYPDPWPGNHILNTLLTKLSMNIFGQEQWAARLPNMLSFALYFYAAYHICLQLFKNHLLPFLGCLAFFIFNPFLLDFFSLCRGYGMSNALMLCSAMFLLKGFVTQQWRAVWWGFAFSILASYANFTLLIYWCAVTAMIAIFAWNDYLNHKNTKQFFTKIGILAGIDLIYLLLIYTPIHKMQSTDQFVYWQSNGFFRDTIISLIENSRYGSK